MSDSSALEQLGVPLDLHPIIVTGETVETMARFPPKVFHVVVTSPPYAGLRDYGVCDCAVAYRDLGDPAPDGAGERLRGNAAGRYTRMAPRADCPKCGGTGRVRGVGNKQFGNEPIIDCLAWARQEPPCGGCFVCGVRRWAAGVRRILRDDGIFWLNIGDCYIGSGKGPTGRNGIGNQEKRQGFHDTNWVSGPGLKNKDLAIVPARVALALQMDGWHVRSDSPIWWKPNPMPESVPDRPTRAHEYVWMLTKTSEPTYWVHREGRGTRTEPEPDYRWVDGVDSHEEIAPPPGWETELFTPPPELFGPETLTPGEVKETFGPEKRWARVNLWKGRNYYYDGDAERNPYSELTKPDMGRVYTNLSTKPYLVNGVQDPSDTKRSVIKSLERHEGSNLRSVWVWEIPTESFKGAHFATFPEELPERCIRLSTSERGCCPACGAPYERKISREVRDPKPTAPSAEYQLATGGHSRSRALSDVYDQALSTVRTTSGWFPTCACNAGAPIPCLTLDPFAGSGTVPAVSRRLGRRSVGIELNPEYAKMARKRAGKEAAVTTTQPDQAASIKMEASGR